MEPRGSGAGKTGSQKSFPLALESWMHASPGSHSSHRIVILRPAPINLPVPAATIPTPMCSWSFRSGHPSRNSYTIALLLCDLPPQPHLFRPTDPMPNHLLLTTEPYHAWMSLPRQDSPRSSLTGPSPPDAASAMAELAALGASRLPHSNASAPPVGHIPGTLVPCRASSPRVTDTPTIMLIPLAGLPWQSPARGVRMHKA